METNELYLKTAFCCMACDGEIADEELDLVKTFAKDSDLFKGLEIEAKLNEYVADINANGQQFLAGYIKDVASAELTEEQEINLVKIAIKMIEADNKIEYSEISFFKKIRFKLAVEDETLMKVFEDETLFEKFPEVEPEDFLLPDVMVKDEMDWNVTFSNIKLVEA